MSADDEDFVFVSPAAAPSSRPPNKVQLRTIRRQVQARRKQGEDVFTDEEVEKAGYTAAAAPAAAAPAAAATAPHVKPVAAVARKPSPRRTKSPLKVGSKAGGSKGGGGRLAPKSELKKIKQAVAARRRAGEEGVHTDEEVTRAGWHLDALKLSDGPVEAHPAGGPPCDPCALRPAPCDPCAL